MIHAIRSGLPLLSLLPVLPLAGCEPAADPHAVATRFWEAARRANIDRAAELVSATSVATVSDPGSAGSGITDVTLGHATIAEDRATVETRIVNDWAGSPREIRFATRLVLELGRWRVDLDGTADGIVQSMTPPRWLGRVQLPQPVGGDTVMARDTAGMR